MAGIHRLFACKQHDARSGYQRHEEFEHRDVKRERRYREQDVLFGDSQLLLHEREEVDNGLMRNLHAFRVPVEPEV